jgi:tRNA modification GTPase
MRTCRRKRRSGCGRRWRRSRPSLTRHLADDRRGERLREGIPARHRRPAQRRQVEPAERPCPARGGDRSGEPGDDPGRDRGSSRPRGYPVLLADTAGLREATEAIESEGVRRSLRTAEEADLKLVVFDGAAWARDRRGSGGAGGRGEHRGRQQERHRASGGAGGGEGVTAIPISALTGAGLSALLHAGGSGGGAALGLERRRRADAGAPPSGAGALRGVSGPGSRRAGAGRR